MVIPGKTTPHRKRMEARNLHRITTCSGCRWNWSNWEAGKRCPSMDKIYRGKCPHWKSDK